MAIDAAILRRMRNLLPEDDLAALGSDLRGGLPGATAVPTASGLFANLGQGPFPASSVPGVPVTPFGSALQPPGDPFASPEAAQAYGYTTGLGQVSQRLADQQAAGLGTFTDPRTGQPAVFGTGRFLTTPAAFTAAIPGDMGEDLNDRLARVRDAVERRLEEMVAAEPIRSPTPAPPITRRGRFGT